MLYPTIGIPWWEKGMFCRLKQINYTRCLQRTGAVAQFLVPGRGSENARDIVDKCDGFLFPDGPDIQPLLYGQEPLAGCGKTDAGRDAFELSFLREALAVRKPLFCVCRGMQLLNVAFGGTLIQDIHYEQEYQHFDFLHRASATHPVELAEDGFLAALLDSDYITVNSLHHQAVDVVGDGLEIGADSPDGFVEALELEGYPFCLAVQWSPQYMAATTPAQQKLFQAFVDACRNTSASPDNKLKL